MTDGRDEVIAEIASRAAQDCVDASETLIYPSASMENIIAAAIREALSRVGGKEAEDAARYRAWRDSQRPTDECGTDEIDAWNASFDKFVDEELATKEG